MSATLQELEQELELESVHEMHHESHQETQEQEQFFGALAKLASKAARSPALQNMASQAARSALSLLAESETEYELAGYGEGEDEDELESELNPVRKVYSDAMMEHMAHMATEAESEAEAAEAFLPLIPMLAAKLAPLAMKGFAKVAPKIMGRVMKVAPQLTRGIGKVAQTLFRNRRMRPLLRTLPAIGRRTVGRLAQRVARGQAVTPRVAVRTLAQQASRVLSNPHRCVHAYRRSRALDRQHHQFHPGLGRCPQCGNNGRAVNGHSHAGGLGGTCVKCC